MIEEQPIVYCYKWRARLDSNQFGTVVGLVAKQLAGLLGATDQTLGWRTIVRLAAAQEDGKKTAFSICDCVDLRIAPAS